MCEKNVFECRVQSLNSNVFEFKSTMFQMS
jgi:hypothetical protein